MTRAAKCPLCGKYHLNGACRSILQGGTVKGNDTIYQCREDFVLIRIVNRGVSAGGVAYADVSPDGKDHFVVSVGPKAEDVQPGDRVMSIAQQGSFVFLPNTRDLYVTRASNIAIVLGGE